LKQLVPIFLLIAFATQTFNQGVIVLSYYANPSSFAVKCENKARPMMHCNGKCQMMKELKQEEKRDGANGELKLSLKVDPPSSKSFFPSLQVFALQCIQPTTQYSSVILSDGNLPGIFHPPSLV